jgi:hypothetical protein
MPAEYIDEALPAADTGTDDPFADSPPKKAASPTPAPRAATPPEPPPAPPSPARDEAGRFIPKAKHSPYWLSQAAEIGLRDEFVQAMDPDELRQAIRLEADKKAWAHRGAVPETSEPIKPGEQPAHEPELTVALKKYSEDNQAGLDDTVVDHLRAAAKVVNALSQRVAQLESAAGILAQDKHARDARDWATQVDNAFAALGPDYEPFFGKGTIAELEGTAFHTRRSAIYGAAQIDRQKDSRAALNQKLKAAAEKFYAPSAVVPAAVKDEPTPEQQRWIEAGTERPTSRTKPELPKGVERAKREFAERERLRNGTEGGSQTFENW